MKPISGIIGLVLVLASVVIVVLSTSEEGYTAKKGEMVTKYVQNSAMALEQGDVNEAIKYAKLAIEVDASNNNGFRAYEKAMELKYKPSVEETVESPVMDEAPAKQAPAFEAAPDMGC